jgi:uncharacterized Rmd1/YagE family protein
MQAKVPLRLVSLAWISLMTFRKTKTSQKEVLLPENATAIESDPSSSDEEESPVRTTSYSPTRSHSPTRPVIPRKPPPTKPKKSLAERIAKSQRDESMLPRVTGYCTCESYKLLATQKFLTERHHVKGPVIYDEALYARYELPLRNGEGGFRVRSGKAKKDDSSREYSSDSETQVRSKRKDSEDDNTVGSSAMLDGQGNNDDLLFSPPKPINDGPTRGVHFFEEQDQNSHSFPENPHERPTRRRDSSPIDDNALSNLAERTLSIIPQ